MRRSLWGNQTLPPYRVRLPTMTDRRQTYISAVAPVHDGSRLRKRTSITDPQSNDWGFFIFTISQRSCYIDRNYNQKVNYV